MSTSDPFVFIIEGKSIKDFKATLFINNLIINDCDKDYTINKIELDLEAE